MMLLPFLLSSVFGYYLYHQYQINRFSGFQSFAGFLDYSGFSSFERLWPFPESFLDTPLILPNETFESLCK